jgi:hypothetical protein
MPYPEQEALLRDLVENDHAHLDDEPLVVAIYFRSRSVPNEECLFEVMRDFGLNEVSEDNSIFQVQFGNAPKLPLPAGDRLRLFLTSPIEFQYAVQQNWPEVQDIQQAIAEGQYSILYQRPNDTEATAIVRSLTGRAVAA